MSSNKYKGVYHIKVTGMYRAIISVNGKTKYLGTHKDPYQCFLLYQSDKARQLSKTELKHSIYDELKKRKMLHREKRHSDNEIDRFYAEVDSQGLAIVIKIFYERDNFTVNIKDYDLDTHIGKQDLEIIYNKLISR